MIQISDTQLAALTASWAMAISGWIFFMVKSHRLKVSLIKEREETKTWKAKAQSELDACQRAWADMHRMDKQIDELTAQLERKRL